MAQIAICIALIIVCSWLHFPLVVPITMQTFAIFSVLGLVGGKKGMIAILSYVLIGALGLPVFSGFKGGIGVILHDISGGYIIGFILIALIYWIAVAIFGRKPTVEIISLIIGLFVCYLTGTGWYLWINISHGGSLDFARTLYVCVVPFILPDLVKLGISAVLVGRIRKHLKL